MVNDFYSVTVAAAKDPIGVKDAKDFMRIDAAITEDDVLIQGCITAAVLDGEAFTNRCFVSRTFLGKFSGLDISKFEPCPFVQVRRAPLVSITSVEVMVNDALSTVSTDDYDLKESSAFSRILFNDSGSLTVDPVPYPLEVVFIAGYGDPKDVPDDIKTALYQHVLYLYENRGDVQAEGKLTMPGVTKAIYSGNYRILNTFG